MTYEKPEVTVLGAASLLIKGGSSKSVSGEQGTLQIPTDCELDD